MNLHARWRLWLLMRSIKKHGVVQPILVTSDGYVLDGAHRTLACVRLGIKIPTVVIDAKIIMLDPNILKTWLSK